MKHEGLGERKHGTMLLKRNCSTRKRVNIKRVRKRRGNMKRVKIKRKRKEQNRD